MRYDDHSKSMFCHRPKNICPLRNVGYLLSVGTEALHPKQVNHCPNCGAELRKTPPRD